MNYSKKSDKELISALCESSAQDGGIISELISRYMKTVFSAAAKYSGSADYEDLVSDGMQGLLSAIRNYVPEKGEFSAFVAACVNNKLKNTAKKSLRRASRIADDPDELEAIPDPRPTPEEAVLAQENSESFMSSLVNELTALELRCVEGIAMGMSYGDISEWLKVSRKTVDNALSRARAKMRRLHSNNQI